MIENWTIKDNLLVVFWGKTESDAKKYEFMLDYYEGTLFMFLGVGNQAVIRLYKNEELGHYVPMTNNTKLKAHVKLDLTKLSPYRDCPFQIKFGDGNKEIKYDHKKIKNEEE
jgi:hypothetical protein